MKLKFSLKTLAVLMTICALCVAWRVDHWRLTKQIQALQFAKHVDTLTVDLTASRNHLKRARTAARMGAMATEDHSLFGSPDVIIGYVPPLIDALSDSVHEVAMQANNSLEIIAVRVGSTPSGGGFVFPVPAHVIQSWKEWHASKGQ